MVYQTSDHESKLEKRLLVKSRRLLASFQRLKPSASQMPCRGAALLETMRDLSFLSMISYSANPKDMEEMMKCDQRLGRHEKQIEWTRAKILD